MANRFRIAPALALLGALVAAPACTTGGYAYRGDRPYDRDDRARYVERIAHDNGFREGRVAGDKDARHGKSFSPERHGDFRDADDGYRRDFGDKEFYRREFREGYRAGYGESYDAYRGGYRR